MMLEFIETGRHFEMAKSCKKKYGKVVLDALNLLLGLWLANHEYKGCQ